MRTKNSKFKIGDLVVQKLAEFNNEYFIICKIIGMEYIDESSEMWFEGYDTEPYYFYECEIVYLRQQSNFHLELGDVICYDEEDLVSVTKYLNTFITVQDYIDFTFNGKNIEI